MSEPIPAGLPTIGKATMTLLRSKGVSTAWQVISAGEDGYRAVPGLGPAKWAVLRDWALTALSFTERRRLLETGPMVDDIEAAVPSGAHEDDEGFEVASILARIQLLTAIDERVITDGEITESERAELVAVRERAYERCGEDLARRLERQERAEREREPKPIASTRVRMREEEQQAGFASSRALVHATLVAVASFALFCGLISALTR